MMAEIEACNQEGEARTVMVGIQLDARGKELLDWAVSKVAEPGERILAVHVCRDSDLKHTSTLSLIKVLDDYLAAYEDICNLKQVALVGRVSRGNSIRKVLVKEAKLCNAMVVLVGVIKHCSLGGSASLAKYCAKKLPSTAAIMAVRNGKVIFERKADAPSRGEQPKPTVTAVPHSRMATRAEKFIPRSAERPQLAGAGNKDQSSNGSSASPEIMAKETSEYKLGWPPLRRTASDIPEAKKKMSVVQWAMSLPNRSLLLSKLQSDLVTDLNNILANSSCKWFRYRELQSATNNFSSENVIGKGGSSKVYKGRLRGGQKVAIKLSKLSDASSKDFLLEVDIITKLQHNRIVPLIGICVEDNTLTSVYNYFSKGSLEENLHGTKDKPSLSWDHRYKVAVGVAEALTYLHNDCSQPVIHRDLKSSNILIDDDFEPQLSDFGLAIWAPTASVDLTRNDVVGTFGYLAPEYFMHGKVSDKIDVYSFGVVLLELLTGKKSICDESPKGQGSLVMWAKPMLARIKIPVCPYEDFWVWSPDQYGDANTKSVYRFLSSPSVLPLFAGWPAWNQIWHLQIPYKIRIFLWKLSHGRLLTKQYLSKFNTTLNPECSLCHSSEETTKHLFFSCPFASQIWMLFQQKSNYSFHYMQTWKDGNWIKEGDHMDSLSRKCFISLFAICLWGIWKARNEASFQSVKATATVVWHRSLEYYYEVLTTQQAEGHPLISPFGAIWEPPSQPCFTMNVDGSFVGPSEEGGTGFIVWNTDNSLFCAGMNHHKFSSVLECEAWSLRIGIEAAIKMNIQRILVGTDSSQLCQILLREAKCPWKVYNIIKDIWSLSDQLEDFFVHALDPNIAVSDNDVQVRRMILAASLCIARRADFRPQISQILSLLQGREGIEAWISSQDSMSSSDCQDEEICAAESMESHLGVALLDIEDNESVTSFEQSYLGSLEEHLRGRWSRSSSFD